MTTERDRERINSPVNSQSQTSTPSNNLCERTFQVATAVSALAVLMCACGPTAGPLLDSHEADTKAILANCPAGRSVDSRASLDMSASRIKQPLSAHESETLRATVRRTVICGGVVEISAFFGSVASTVPLYSGKLQLDGATDNARLRREPELTDTVMETVETNLTQLQFEPSDGSTGGTDILGQLGQSAEFQRQLDPVGDTSNLSVLLVTDGEDNATLHFSDPALSREHAVAIADEVDVPNLSGAAVTFVGIGKTSSGAIAKTAYVDALKAAWTRVCERTGAAHCIIVTDPVSGQ
ncbi:hypothetical protein ACH49M_12455 [Rhodococcus qingshengii]|uniref:hypothetical protein n=1 Tax=Rhodococcus qingshengii TaxID=334542 RepID=UPI0037022EFB